MSNKDEALKYAQLKIPIFPLHWIKEDGSCSCSRRVNCGSKGKHPIYSEWYEKSTTDEDRINNWWNNNPNANIGVPTGIKSGWLVLDVDSGGEETLAKFEEVNGKLPTTVTAITGSGGRHYIFKYPEGKDIPNRTRFAKGLDTRSTRGLIVVSPSNHVSGNRYKWLDGDSPWDIELSEPPKWLLDEMCKTKQINSKETAIETEIEEGSRNSTLTSIAGTMRRRGLAKESILAALMIENQRRCSPPLEYGEVETIVNSIMKYTPEEPATDIKWDKSMSAVIEEKVDLMTDVLAVFETEFLTCLALARNEEHAVYSRVKAKLKEKFKNKINLNDFEKSVKKKELQLKAKKNEEFTPVTKFTGLDEYEFNIPNGWNVSLESGVIKKVFSNDGGERNTAVSFSPIVITRRFINIDNDFEKLELSFYRDGRWKRIVAPRTSIFNKNTLINLGNTGLPVSSNTASDLISYLDDFEACNKVKVVKSISRIGWVNGGYFFPYYKDDSLEFESDSKEISTIMSGLETSGDENKWLETAMVVRKNPIARFIIAASFASILIEPLRKRVFFLHLWHNSRSGKTATLKFASSIWGNPQKLIGSFNSTTVGLERMASALRNLPFAIDELQVLNTKRISVDSIIYMLSQGQGRTRGGKDGGLQDTSTWRNIILTTGEEAMLGTNTQDGANSRTLEIYAKPVDDIELASKMHEVSEQHYGHVGKKFVESVCEHLKSNPEFLNQAYENIKSRLKKKYPESIHIDEVSIICLGDFLSSMNVFGEDIIDDPNPTIDCAIDTANKVLDNIHCTERTDNIERAWETLKGWLIANSSRFSIHSPTPRYGIIDEYENYLVIPSFAHKALEEAGFSPKKVFSGFAERGYIESQIDSSGIKRLTLGRNLVGKLCRVYVVKIPKHEDVESEFLPFD